MTKLKPIMVVMKETREKKKPLFIGGQIEHMF